MADKEKQIYFDAIKQIIKGLSGVMGSRSEIILHDLSHPESSAIALEGNVTSRSIGAPVTNLVMQAIKRYDNNAPNLIGYNNQTKDGRNLKSSTIFLRDSSQQIIGCLCFNTDLSDYAAAKDLLQEICECTELDLHVPSAANEIFAQDINEVVEVLIRNEMDNINKPVSFMTKEDKLKLVTTLEEKGIFDVKGSIDLVANFLGVSQFTIYNYLKEIRSVKGK